MKNAIDIGRRKSAAPIVVVSKLWAYDCNGNNSVSKTENVGSIPTAPAEKLMKGELLCPDVLSRKAQEK